MYYVVKLILIDSCLKYNPSQHESLELVFGTPIFNTMKIHSLCIGCLKIKSYGNLENPFWISNMIQQKWKKFKNRNYNEILNIWFVLGVVT